MRIAIAGLGLIGGSLAGALRRAGFTVCGYDLSSGRARVAAERGLVDEVVGNLAEAVRGVDVVLLAAPIQRIVAMLPAADSLAAPDAVILDTGSVQGPVVDTMALLPGAHRMAGGHPLAGKETSGPGAADPDLFAGKPFFLSPTPATSPDTLRRAADLAGAVGAVPVTVDAHEHDRILAGTSHLPQILSSTLSASIDADVRFLGSGFRDMTRLASSDPSIWRDVLLANADYIVDAGRSYMESLRSMLSAIEARDPAGVEAALEAGRRSREVTV